MYEYTMSVFAIMYTTIFVWLNFILTDEAHLSFFKMSIKYLFTRCTVSHNFAHSLATRDLEEQIALFLQPRALQIPAVYKFK